MFSSDCCHHYLIIFGTVIRCRVGAETGQSIPWRNEISDVTNSMRSDIGIDPKPNVITAKFIRRVDQRVHEWKISLVMSKEKNIKNNINQQPQTSNIIIIIIKILQTSSNIISITSFRQRAVTVRWQVQFGWLSCLQADNLLRWCYTLHCSVVLCTVSHWNGKNQTSNEKKKRWI